MSTSKKQKLIELAEIVMGQSPDSSYYNSDGFGMTFLQGCAEFGKISPFSTISTTQVKKIGRGNSILFSVRAPVGKINWADKDYCIGRGLSAITGLKIDQKYLYQYFLHLRNETRFSSQGSTFESINFDELSKIEIVFPENKSEQTRIAEILSTADQAIEQTEALIAKYQRIKTGLMQDLLTFGIDEQGNIRSKATHKFVVKNGIEVPEEWEVSTLEKLTRSVITYGIVQAGPHIPNGIPYIRTGDMSEDFLSIENLLRTTDTIASKFQRSAVEINDIVFALRATIGKVLVVPKELHGANLTQGTARIAPNWELISTSFLLWSMRMPYVKNQILSVQKGTTFAEISLGDLRQIKITYPKSFTEQERITLLIEQQEEVIQSYKSNLSKLLLLKTGLMQDLLSGKVRASQPVES